MSSQESRERKSAEVFALISDDKDWLVQRPSYMPGHSTEGLIRPSSINCLARSSVLPS
jgi:hypothetical protein